MTNTISFKKADKKRQPFTVWQRLLLTLGVIIGALSIVAIIGSVLPTQAMKEDAFADKCRSNIERQLKDPDSATIEDPIFGVHVIDKAEDRYEMSGVGRARNGFGGMTGFTYRCTGGYNEPTGNAYANARLD